MGLYVGYVVYYGWWGTPSWFYRVYKIPLSGSTGPSPGPKQPRRGPERPGEGSPGEARKTRRDPERARKHPDKRPERRPDSTPTQTRIRRMLMCRRGRGKQLAAVGLYVTQVRHRGVPEHLPAPGWPSARAAQVAAPAPQHAACGGRARQRALAHGGASGGARGRGTQLQGRQATGVPTAATGRRASARRVALSEQGRARACP